MRRLSIILLLVLLTTTGAGCFGGGSSSTVVATPQIEIWRVFDDGDTFDAIIDSYRAIHPNVKIEYRKLRFDEYEDELIRAFAEGRGPDIFSVHNTWLPAYQDLMEPMPSSITVTQYETQGTLRKETVVVEVESKTMTTSQLKSAFVEQVARDVIMEYKLDEKTDPVEKIYGLPLAMDTLALFYNKDLLNAAGIPTTPTSWSEFQDDVVKLTDFDGDGEIRQSGAAIGTSGNVERAPDILSLLMMQNGTQMIDERGRIAFAAVPKDAPKGVYPGYDAVSFYTDFSNPTKEVYTWNDNFDGSFEAFTNGETAFFLGYSYHIPLIRTASPKLNFAVAPVPQITGGKQANFANYWVEGVSNQTDVSDWAWDFIQFAADEDNVGSYLQEAQKPTALRSLIADQLDDEWLGPFAEQTLTAESWYHGYDVGAMENAFNDLIDIIAAGTDDPDNEMTKAANIVADTYSK